MAIPQQPKTRIDTGVRGSPSTGDILYDGGNFLNTNFNSVYNTFGDQRLFAMGIEGAGNQFLHATGYYQQNQSYNTALEMGSMHCIVAQQPVSVSLPKGQLGEGIVFISVDGTSISPKNPFTIICNTADNIANAGQRLVVTSPNSRIVIWGARKAQSSTAVTWEYSITPMFGNYSVPIDKNYEILGKGATFPIAHKDQFQSIKLLVTSSMGSQATAKFKSCEILLHIDKLNNKVYSTEYAVLKDGDDFYTTSFAIDSLSGQVTMTVKPVNTAQPIQFAIKSISTVSLGTVAEQIGA